VADRGLVNLVDRDGRDRRLPVAEIGDCCRGLVRLVDGSLVSVVDIEI
jgi:hypothetical protein